MRRLLGSVATGLAVVGLGLMSAGRLPAADGPDGKEDRAFLRRNGVTPDGLGLLAYFARRVVTGDDERRYERLIARLGDSSYRQRERAAHELAAEGPKALRFAERAQRDADPEVARLARRCFERMRLGPGPGLPLVAARVLAEERPAGAIAALLRFVPFADDDEVEDQVLRTLAVLDKPGGDGEPALRAATKDAKSARRAAAGYVLGRRRDTARRDLAAALLTDPEPRVRWRTAEGLIAGADKRAVPALIALLTANPPELGWQAEEYLDRLAGERRPAFPAPGTDARVAARDRQKAWAEWWRTNAETADLGKAAPEAGFLHRTLIVQTSPSKVFEVDRGGKILWSIDNTNNPIDAQLKPGGRVVVAEYTGRCVSERDRTGKVIWKQALESEPIRCQLLPGGRAFVATGTTLHEFGPDGKSVAAHKVGDPNGFYAAHRGAAGRVVTSTSNGLLREFDAATGKQLGTHDSKMGMTFCLQLLPNGHRLQAQWGDGGLVREFDPQNKEVWKYSIAEPFHAERLSNGNTLIASRSERRVVEVSRAGKVVWEYKVEGLVMRVHRR